MTTTITHTHMHTNTHPKHKYTAICSHLEFFVEFASQHTYIPFQSHVTGVSSDAFSEFLCDVTEYSYSVCALCAPFRSLLRTRIVLHRLSVCSRDSLMLHSQPLHTHTHSFVRSFSFLLIPSLFPCVLFPFSSLPLIRSLYVLNTLLRALVFVL